MRLFELRDQVHADARHRGLTDSAVHREIVKEHYERRAHEEVMERIGEYLKQLAEGYRRHSQEIKELKQEVKDVKREIARFRADFQAALPDDGEGEED